MIFRATAVLLLVLTASLRADPVLPVPYYPLAEDGTEAVLVPLETYSTLHKVTEKVTQTAPREPGLKGGKDRIENVTAMVGIRGASATVDLLFTLKTDPPPASPARPPRLMKLLDRADIIVTGYSGPGELQNDATGCLVLLSAEPGAPARLSYRIAVPVEKSTRRHHVTFPVPRSLIQDLSFVIEETTPVEVTLKGALPVEKSFDRKATRVRARGLGRSGIELVWEPLERAQERRHFARAQEAMKPEVSARVRTLLILGEETARARYQIDLLVRKNPVEELQVDLPAAQELVDASGEALADWDQVPTPSGKRITFRFGKPRMAATRVELETELPLTSGILFLPACLPEAYREEHELGFKVPSNVVLDPAPVESGWRPLESSRASPEFQKLVTDSLAPSFARERFPGTPEGSHLGAIALTLTRHQQVSLLQATVDLAEATTLLTQEGRVLGRLLLHVKNNTRQFLTLTHEKGLEILTVYVGGSAVRAAQSGPRQILIPLGKSVKTDTGAAPFPVEITFEKKGDPLKTQVPLSLELPRPDLAISSLRWKIGIPDGYTLHARPGDIRAESGYRAVTFDTGVLGTQSQSLATWFNESTLPLKIHLPEGFTLFDFSRDLIQVEEARAPAVVFEVTQSTPAMVKRAGLFLLGIVFFYLLLRHRPPGRERIYLMALGLSGTGVITSVQSWAALSTPLHLALGIFVGALVFGLSRLALASDQTSIADPA